MTFSRTFRVLMVHARLLLALVRDRLLVPLLAALPLLTNCTPLFHFQHLADLRGGSPPAAPRQPGVAGSLGLRRLTQIRMM